MDPCIEISDKALAASPQVADIRVIDPLSDCVNLRPHPLAKLLYFAEIICPINFRVIAPQTILFCPGIGGVHDDNVDLLFGIVRLHEVL